MPWLWEAAIAKYGSVCDEMKKQRENMKSPFSSAIRIDERTSSGRLGLGATWGRSGRVVWATSMVNKAFTASLRFTPPLSTNDFFRTKYFLYSILLLKFFVAAFLGDGTMI